FAIVVGAPVTEEIAFRGWLSGRLGHALAALLLAIGVFAVPMLAGEEQAVVGFTAAIVLIVAAGAAILWGRRQTPMRWFAREFPFIFWATAAVFALVHLINFEQASLIVLLPLVLPQFVAGLMFGYVRVHYGLWAAMLLHALHNGTAIAVVSSAEVLAYTGLGV
ncbi:MAG: CPBP family glutamic-type intramembrane protease, partial [Pontixanthobacter sp.]